MSDDAYQWMEAEHQSGTDVIRFTTRALADHRVIEALRDELCRLVDAGSRPLVLDFGTVRQYSSAMLACLLAVQAKIGETGGHLVLRNLCPEIHDLLAVTQTGHHFQIEAAPRAAPAS